MSITVQIIDARKNPLFEEWQVQITKFLRFSEAVPCEFCGRKSKHHWTQTVPFRCADLKYIFTITPSEKLFEPGNQVCRKHILMPQVSQ